MIDTTKLTANELLGLQYATAKRNKADQEAFTPTDDVPEFVPMTEAQYAESVMRGAAQSWYAELMTKKKQMALEIFDGLDPEQQAALRQQLGIPDGVVV